MSDKTGKRKGFAAIGLLSMTIAFVALAFSFGLVLISLVIALGVVAAMIPPIASSLPPEIVGQGYASVGFGITAMCSNIGAALSQPWIGSILDSTQSYAPCLFGMAGVALTGALVAYTMKTR